MEDSSNIASYKLPVCDVDTKRRNFPGYSEENVFTLSDIMGGDESGTTDTDSKTDPKGSDGYTTIYSKRR